MDEKEYIGCLRLVLETLCVDWETDCNYIPVFVSSEFEELNCVSNLL